MYVALNYNILQYRFGTSDAETQLKAEDLVSKTPALLRGQSV